MRKPAIARCASRTRHPPSPAPISPELRKLVDEGREVADRHSHLHRTFGMPAYEVAAFKLGDTLEAERWEFVVEPESPPTGSVAHLETAPSHPPRGRPSPTEESPGGAN
jgi:hypothetical protein